MEEKAKQVAQLLKVLANETRLLVLCALTEKPMIVGELFEQIGTITQPALSQHLAVLKAQGILDSEKTGQYITYFIKDHRVEAVMSVLKHHYCNPDNNSN